MICLKSYYKPEEALDDGWIIDHDHIGNAYIDHDYIGNAHFGNGQKKWQIGSDHIGNAHIGNAQSGNLEIKIYLTPKMAFLQK